MTMLTFRGAAGPGLPDVAAGLVLGGGAGVSDRGAACVGTGAELGAAPAAAIAALGAPAGEAGPPTSCPKAMKCTHPDSDAAIGINSPITARMTDPPKRKSPHPV